MKKASFKHNKTDNPYNTKLYNLTINGLTTLEVLVLVRALRFYDSTVGNDVLAYVKNAASEHPTLFVEVEKTLKDLEKTMERND